MLASLVPFASQGDVEQIIVDAIKHSYLQVWTGPVSMQLSRWVTQSSGTVTLPAGRRRKLPTCMALAYQCCISSCHGGCCVGCCFSFLGLLL